MARNPLKLLIPMSLRHEHRFANGYLAPKGWHKSAQTGTSIDHDGPIPWITYPARAMLERVVKPHHRVFEYGAGNSSLWWAKRVKEIVSVENHPQWMRDVAARAPSNLSVVAKPAHTPISPEQEAILADFFALNLEPAKLWDDEATLWHGLLTNEFAAYAVEIANFPKGYFDIVVVDGMARVLSAWLAARYVNPKGFVVFDNSNRPQYNDGYAALIDSGFKRIDFYGPNPVNYIESCTSIFARDLDWLSANTTLPEDHDCDLKTAFVKYGGRKSRNAATSTRRIPPNSTLNVRRSNFSPIRYLVRLLSGSARCDENERLLWRVFGLSPQKSE